MVFIQNIRKEAKGLLFSKHFYVSVFNLYTFVLTEIVIGHTLLDINQYLELVFKKEKYLLEIKLRV